MSAPDLMKHARGIARHIEALRDQVFALTDHGPSVGTHREELLRTLLGERLPSKCGIETGFVITGSDQSGEIDILIVNRDKPILSRSADNKVFVTPDSVLGMIEVKSSLAGPKAFRNALSQLASNANFCSGRQIWTGLFVLEQAVGDFDDCRDDVILDALDHVAAESGFRVQSVSVGSDMFFRYWENSAVHAEGIIEGPAWHSYHMIELAPAYFIGNFVAELSELPDEYLNVWFPIPGTKERERRWYAPVGGPPLLFPEYEGKLREYEIKGPLRRAEKWQS